MSILAIEADTVGVSAAVVSRAGEIVARGHRGLALSRPRDGHAELAPDELWLATLSAVRQAVDQVEAGALTAIGITAQRETVLLWDRETLGSPRPAIVGDDRRTAALCSRLRDAGHEERVRALTGLDLDPRLGATKLRWLAENEPRTWALVESGRYGVGTVDSYLVARMTRGLEHVTDVSHSSRTLLLDLAAGDWSAELCSLFSVPRDALPELVPTWGELAVTDRRSFLDLELPVTAIAGDRQSALFGQGCFDAGDATCSLDDPVGTGTGTGDIGAAFILNTGMSVEPPTAGSRPTVAWRSASGDLTYAHEGTTPPIGAMSALRVHGAASADDALCQLLADRLGVRLDRPLQVEATLRGAAFLAGLGSGLWSSTDDLRALWQRDRSFVPAR